MTCAGTHSDSEISATAIEVTVKAATPAYTLISAATTADYGKVVCAAGHLHDEKAAVPTAAPLWASSAKSPRPAMD